MLPDFNRLKVFYWIYSKKGVAAAARELNVTQSAVSQHLMKLETEMKTQLFTRLHKKLVPTYAGKRLFQIMEPFVSDLERGIGEITKARKGPFGLLRIGAPVEFGNRYLTGVFASFRNTYPDVGFHLKLGHPTLLFPLLTEGELDFTFADIFNKKGEFTRENAIYSIEPVINEELTLVCSDTYYQKHINKNHTYENLIKNDFLSYQQHAPAIKSWFKHHFNKSSSQLKVILTVESVQGIIAGLKNHMGLGIIPSHLVREEIDRGEIIHITTSKKEIMSRISIVQLQDKVPNLTEKTFLNHFKKAIKSTLK